MNSNWVKIYTSHDFYKAEIVKQVLIDHEVDAVLMNKQDSAYKFGEVQVHVPESAFQHALEIILENDL
ncbi:hypothetical protein BCY91_01735 [Pelobium manganitolerans]|uniref:DUF2007 domain-containing protein n=1 Tax=Pelobium manganitolerans TaxID=1842495 RepID=A0A419SC13_9SPHI|nr:DUF2007 domain-containing protein [Pelobium manganitolerans]RKD20364.1 hypothetical protein BCY91_01735 [Pelobium manganitolerans]